MKNLSILSFGIKFFMLFLWISASIFAQDTLDLTVTTSAKSFSTDQYVQFEVTITKQSVNRLLGLAQEFSFCLDTENAEEIDADWQFVTVFGVDVPQIFPKPGTTGGKIHFLYVTPPKKVSNSQEEVFTYTVVMKPSEFSNAKKVWVKPRVKFQFAGDKSFRIKRGNSILISAQNKALQ